MSPVELPSNLSDVDNRNANEISKPDHAGGGARALKEISKPDRAAVGARGGNVGKTATPQAAGCLT